MYRNLTMYRFPVAFAASIRDLADALEGPDLQAALAECIAKPCGPMEMSSRGWVSPYGRGFDALFQRVGDRIQFQLGGEDKILPGAAVKKAVEDKLDEIEKRTGTRPNGRARKRIRDEVTVDLIPRAPVKDYGLRGYIDLTRGLVVVDTSSRKAGDAFVSELRKTLGSFPALPLNAEVAPRAVLTSWIADAGDMPDGVTLGDAAELRDSVAHGAVVKVSQQELQGDEIRQHLEAGKQCTRLGVQFSDRIACVIGEDLVVRKFQLLDDALADLGEEAEDIAGELDARFALLGGKVGVLFDTLAEAFTLSKVEG